MSELKIKIPTDPSEVQEAQRLRFQVPVWKCKKGLESSYEQELDVDEFDPFCEHLIVRDRISREVAGIIVSCAACKLELISGLV